MNDSIYEQIQEAADYLRLELTAQEMATIALEQELSEEGIRAVAAVLEHLKDKKRQQIVSTLLRMSRLPLREPKSFENFDFDRLHGKQVIPLKNCLRSVHCMLTKILHLSVRPVSERPI